MGERAEISARPILLAVVVLHNVPQLGLRLSQVIFIAIDSVIGFGDPEWAVGHSAATRLWSTHCLFVSCH